ncbi:hypothetical protein glysoja_030722 [Glycine soja]|uniref:Uncharacterized protein n=1 Tax=Glycine soja TaxID=3848 RepID=A0A0B2SLW0_GLYSO|nr:hypothetical protein glysoja_030722 [Glycine soja]
MGSVDDQIDFIMGDFFLLTPKLKVLHKLSQVALLQTDSRKR